MRTRWNWLAALVLSLFCMGMTVPGASAITFVELESGQTSSQSEFKAIGPASLWLSNSEKSSEPMGYKIYQNRRHGMFPGGPTYIAKVLLHEGSISAGESRDFHFDLPGEYLLELSCQSGGCAGSGAFILDQG